MNASAFNRHLTRKLCWIDGSPTHVSSAKQRQCTRCRRKWSYDGLIKQWLLAQEFCAGHSRREAAVAAGVDVHTAGRHYADFQLALAGYVRRLLAEGMAWRLGDAEKFHRLFRMGLANSSPRQRRRLAAQICFDGLGARKRLDLLCELVFAEKLRLLTVSK
ncbi:MAG: hypothetical protein FGM15_03350 [Chthoniobacterales bacterium]|nr:hypothetical protein [Chthoniobacterales bacterium]